MFVTSSCLNFDIVMDSWTHYAKSWNSLGQRWAAEPEGKC